MEPIVNVEQVSKKFCRRLRRSLWYGLIDLGAALTARSRSERLQLREAEFIAVDNVSLQIKPGECVGLIGHNGAGKSTLLKMLNGLIRPDQGRITIRGRVGALIELGAGFSPVLTGRENIYVNGAILGFSKREIDLKFEAIVDFAELQDAVDAPVQTYSSGMYLRLGFSVAAQLDPDIFLIDELLAVGDLAFRMKCFEHLLALKKTGKAIVVVSHNMIDINRICDRVLVMDGGSKQFDGSTSGGIATYESLLSQRSGRLEEQATDGAARIESVALYDRNGNPAQEFETGNDLFAEVTVSAVRSVAGARLIVHVLTPSVGMLGSFSSPHKGITFNIGPPGAVVRFAIKKMPLLVGSYTLTLSLYGAGVKDFLHAVTNATVFRIVGPPIDTFGYGLCHSIAFEHEWDEPATPECRPHSGLIGKRTA